MIHSTFIKTNEFEKIAKGDKNFLYATLACNINAGDYIALNEETDNSGIPTGRAILTKVTDVETSSIITSDCCAVSFVPCFITCQDNIYTRKLERLDSNRGYEIYNNTEAQP